MVSSCGRWRPAQSATATGQGVLPCQDFKFAIIAALPDGDWVLTRTEVLDWLSAHAAEATGG